MVQVNFMFQETYLILTNPINHVIQLIEIKKPVTKQI